MFYWCGICSFIRISAFVVICVRARACVYLRVPWWRWAVMMDALVTRSLISWIYQRLWGFGWDFYLLIQLHVFSGAMCVFVCCVCDEWRTQQLDVSVISLCTSSDKYARTSNYSKTSSWVINFLCCVYSSLLSDVSYCTVASSILNWSILSGTFNTTVSHHLFE